MRYFRAGMRSRRFLLVCGAATVAALVSVGGYGYAALSGSTSTTTPNVYTACLKAGQLVNVAIGTAPSTTCVKPAIQISWSQTGPQGPQGLSVTSASLSLGDANCPAGGSSFTVGGLTTYACNGTNGTNGKDGTNGTNGTSVSSAVLFPGDANCPSGGSSFSALTGLTYACNGANGTNGTNGTDGTNGTNGKDGTSVTSASLSPGDANCPNGGSSFTSASGTTYACNGADGTNGTNGTTIAAQSCEAGTAVVGIDASGKLLCNCPTDIRSWATFDITAQDSGGNQDWPVGQVTHTDPFNSACSITVQQPDDGLDQVGHPAVASINIAEDPQPRGWAVVDSTGYAPGTHFTVNVDTPACKTQVGIGSVISNFPTCTNSSTLNDTGESTDQAVVTIG